MTPIKSLTFEEILLELSNLAKLRVMVETDQAGNCKIELRAELKKPKTKEQEVLCVKRHIDAIDIRLMRDPSLLVRMPFETLLLAARPHPSE